MKLKKTITILLIPMSLIAGVSVLVSALIIVCLVKTIRS